MNTLLRILFLRLVNVKRGTCTGDVGWEKSSTYLHVYASDAFIAPISQALLLWYNHGRLISANTHILLF